jgi:hypothetical protein
MYIEDVTNPLCKRYLTKRKREREFSIKFECHGHY